MTTLHTARYFSALVFTLSQMIFCSHVRAQDAMQSTLGGKSLIEALNYLNEWGSDRALYLQFDKGLADLTRSGIEVHFYVVKHLKAIVPTAKDGEIGSTEFNPSKGVITLALEECSSNPQNKCDPIEALSHELVHVTTIAKMIELYKARDLSTRPDLQDLLAQMNQEKLNVLGWSLEKFESRKERINFQAIFAPQEFLAYGLTNPIWRDELTLEQRAMLWSVFTRILSQPVNANKLDWGR